MKPIFSENNNKGKQFDFAKMGQSICGDYDISRMNNDTDGNQNNNIDKHTSEPISSATRVNILPVFQHAETLDHTITSTLKQIRKRTVRYVH